MDIKKYLKNDVELGENDIDLDKLTADLRKGYVVEKDVADKYAKEFEAKEKEYTNKITSIQNDYDSLLAKFNDTNNQMKISNLKVAILSNGFRAEDIDEVAELRTTMYSNINDDNEALSKVKERFNKVYFDTKVDAAPEEPKMQTTPIQEVEPQITRNTSIKELIKK